MDTSWLNASPEVRVMLSAMDRKSRLRMGFGSSSEDATLEQIRIEALSTSRLTQAKTYSGFANAIHRTSSLLLGK